MADKPKLTRAERKQIEAVIRKYRGDGKPHTAQDTIPYQIMYPDGICYLGNRRYSQSIEFFDINYLLAQPDDQTAIFEYLCDLYNYLDSSIHVQFTYPNRKSDREQLARSFEMPPCNDGLDPIRQEQTDILKRQLARGNNGSVKTKYITYTIEADNLKAARARLSRISLDIQGYFKIMGAVSRVLDGKERLGGAARHSCTRMENASTLTGSGLPLAGFPPRTLSRHPPLRSRIAVCSRWAASSALQVFCRSLRRS